MGNQLCNHAHKGERIKVSCLTKRTLRSFRPTRTLLGIWDHERFRFMVRMPRSRAGETVRSTNGLAHRVAGAGLVDTTLTLEFAWGQVWNCPPDLIRRS